MGGLAARWAGLDSVQRLEGAHHHAQAIDVVSMALPGFWERPQPLPVQLMEVSPGPNTRAGTVKACRRSHLSFNRGGQVSELLIKEG
jgi:multidrug efflux pump subunit AcrA (membrane-fusion protein)